MKKKLKTLLEGEFEEQEISFIIGFISNHIYNYREDFGPRTPGSKLLAKFEKKIIDK